MSRLRVRVGAIVMSDEGILLVQHRKADQTYWLLPGGGLEAGETIFACAKREVLEETGLSVVPDRVVLLCESIAPSGGRHILNLFVTARLEGGDITPPVDDVISAVAWVPLSKLNELTLYPAVGSVVLEMVKTRFVSPVRYVLTPWV
jgi:8-oxo-dGTP diphosphatase